MIAFIFMLSIAFVVSGSTVAAAHHQPELLVQFGETGHSAGQTFRPRGIAPDPETDNIFVNDEGNARIDEFTEWGQFIRAFGWGVADGSSEALQTCEAKCFAGRTGTGVGEFGAESNIGIAVEPLTHDVYVVDLANLRVEKFTESGEFLLMFGGDVNKTAKTNVCTEAEVKGGASCGAGVSGDGPGDFTWQGRENRARGPYIAVDAKTKLIYVGDNDRIETFEPDGVYSSEIPMAGAGATLALAVNEATGALYEISEEAPGVRKLSPQGAVSSVLDGAGKPTAVGVGAGETLYVTNQTGGTGGSTGTTEIIEYNNEGAQITSFGGGEFHSGLYSTSIATNNKIGDIYVANAAETNSFIRAYGEPPPGQPPSVDPSVAEEFAQSVGTSSATLSGEINPHFFPTSYYLQYGTASCEEGSCIDLPAAPGTPLSSLRGAEVPGSVALADLASGTTYHYRFVATSSAGTTTGLEHTFTTFSVPRAVAACPNAALRSQQGAEYLPDCRAYEAVSPLAKNNGSVLPDVTPYTIGGYTEPRNGSQAAASGESITYESFTAFPGSAGSLIVNQYLASRNAAGWSTTPLNVPQAPNHFADGEPTAATAYLAFSTELTNAVLNALEPPLAGAPAGYNDLYMRNNEAGIYVPITAEAPTNSNIKLGEQDPSFYFEGATPTFSHVVFASNGDYYPGAVGSLKGEKLNLYEWSDGELRLVNITPAGNVSPESSFTSVGGGPRIEGEYVGAISGDGSHIVWTDSVDEELLDRINGTETIELDASTIEPKGGGGGIFAGASADGERVFFMDARKLTANAVGGQELYEYNLETQTLTNLTADAAGPGGAKVGGVVGISEDGSYVYFVAHAALAPGTPAGEDHLFVWHEGSIRFVANLAAADTHDWHGSDNGLQQQTAAVTPSGTALAFQSIESLTGYDNARLDGAKCFTIENGGATSRCPEVYLYNFVANALTCISCNPSGERPLGGSTLVGGETANYQPRFLTTNGSRLFFDSEDALVPGDVNGVQDVYEWEQNGEGSCRGNVGCVYLISNGADAEESTFADASADGRDVFFTTADPLIAHDSDNNNVTLYDARAGGGFATSSPPASPCVGEDCKPLASSAPVFQAPSSEVFEGPANALLPPPHVKPAKKRGHATKRCASRRRRSGCMKARGSRRRRAKIKKSEKSGKR
ncbi:MAG: hypothetical protein WB698_04645 [Solirubrobacteraceae bacterium]